MTAIPKPVRRKRSKKEPIPRNAERRGTRTPARRKARKASKAVCDKLWSQYIKRDPRCVFVGQILAHGEDVDRGWREADGDDWSRVPHACKGPLQAMHCIAKGPYPSARYELWNGVPGCAGAHTYLTNRPELWTLWLQSRWGDALYAERLRAANHPAKHDYDAVAERLRAL